MEEDVVYLINQDERREFLQLKTDAERDQFIDAFWDMRNPQPGSAINTFKEEHYRRLAYVRSNFGDPRYDDGWRTDMGRVYITLGPPKQLAKHHIGRRTRPVEIWFYESPSPALPPYFNLVFYQRSEGDPYTLYSPHDDGPTRIVTDEVHDNAQALHVIDQILGAEATHAMVTLLPGERINIDNPEPSMESERLLMALRDLPDQKLERDRIARLKLANREKVTASIYTGANTASLDTMVLRDDHGRQTVHVLMRLEHLDPRLVGTLPDKRTGYDLTLQTRVISSQGKALYQQSDNFVGALTDAAVKASRERLFGAEARIPLEPGSYVIEATLTNDLTHEAIRTRKSVTVPSAPPGALGMSDLLAYTGGGPVRDPDGQLPFSISRLRFAPRGTQTVLLHAGEKLPVLFQLWFPQSTAAKSIADSAASASAAKTETANRDAVAGAVAKTVHAHYVIGNVAESSGKPPVEEDEDVEVKNLDDAGNLLTGHTFDTTPLHPGTYRLIAKVSPQGAGRQTSAAMTIKVLPSEQNLTYWTAYGDEAQHPVWREEVLRGVVAERQGKTADAETFYKRALALNPSATEAQQRLDALSKKVAAAPAPVSP